MIVRVEEQDCGWWDLGERFWRHLEYRWERESSVHSV